MGVMQPCCFDGRRNNRKIGIIRLTNNKLRDKTNSKLKNFQKAKKNSSDYSNKGNKTKIRLTEISEEDMKSKKEIPHNKMKNKNKLNNDEIEELKSYNNIRKKKNNKIPNMKSSNSVGRKSSYDKKIKNINNAFHKKSFMKGEKIGEGRFGEIFSGVNISTGGLITIKIFNNNLSDFQKNKIINSLDTLYKLNHKNLVKIIPLPKEEIYDENDNLCIVYQSVNLFNVEEFIKKYGKLDEKIIQKYIKQLLEGLQYLHQNNVFHKNLKPSNILIDADGTIKISDYLIDSLILGDAEKIYKNLLELDQIYYYIPPFFIQSINKYKEQKIEKRKEENQKTSDKTIFENWKSFDLWFLGCLIIEVYSKKKPWFHYNFQNNSEFFQFLGTTHLIPTIPIKLSVQCQDLIKILFDENITKRRNIYDIIFELDFFKMDPDNFTYNNINNKKNDIKYSLNDSHGNSMQNDDSDLSISKSINNESGTQLGKVLEKNKVINLLNSNNDPSFSITYTYEDNNLSFSQSFMNINMNQSNISKGKNINNININKIKNSMPKVEEAQVEQSPDPVKNEEEQNFSFSKPKTNLSKEV